MVEKVLKAAMMVFIATVVIAIEVKAEQNCVLQAFQDTQDRMPKKSGSNCTVGETQDGHELVTCSKIPMKLVFNVDNNNSELIAAQTPYSSRVNALVIKMAKKQGVKIDAGGNYTADFIAYVESQIPLNNFPDYESQSVFIAAGLNDLIKVGYGTKFDEIVSCYYNVVVLGQ